MLAPVHVSATSQKPAAERQTAAALPAGCWQSELEPSHWSSEQGFASAVHAVPLGTFATLGHAAPEPEQLSATSHSPALDRQTVAVDAKPFAGHVALAPVHVSTTSQMPALVRHVLPFARNAQADVQQEVLAPFCAPRSHCSPVVTSPSPQTSTCATDQPSPRAALSSSTLPLHVSDRTVADAPPAVW